MATAILVIGEPGTGKSRAMKDLNPKETIILKPNKKEMPFKGAAKHYQYGKNMYVTTKLSDIGKYLDQINQAKGIKNVVIEDITHFFSKRVIDERKIKSYDKWTELAASFKINIIDRENVLRDDLTIIVIGHVAATSEKLGMPTELTLQTPGKLLENTIKIPSYFTYMFHTDMTEKEDGTMQYRFLTNRTSFKQAKTPEEMFPLYIANNYELIKRYIRAYQFDEEVNLQGISDSIEVSQVTTEGGVGIGGGDVVATTTTTEVEVEETTPEEESSDDVEVENGGLGEPSEEITV